MTELNPDYRDHPNYRFEWQLAQYPELKKLYQTDVVVRATMLNGMLTQASWEETLVQTLLVLAASRKELLDRLVDIGMRQPVTYQLPLTKESKDARDLKTGG